MAGLAANGESTRRALAAAKRYFISYSPILDLQNYSLL